MKILISHLPKHDWWGHGTPIYKNNPAMKQGMVPNQELVEIEMYMMTKLFNRLPVEVIEVDFPSFLDQQNTEQRKHDFVFVRDLFISNQEGKVIISKFSEEARQVESDIMEIMLDSMGYKTIRIPNSNDAKAEGGEFYYCSGPKILFSGACRAFWVLNIEDGRSMTHCYKEYPTHQTVCSELPIVGTNSPK